MAETKTIPALRRYLPVVMPGETFCISTSMDTIRTPAMAAGYPILTVPACLPKAVPCSQDQQERKGKTVAVRETGWRIETMPYQIKNLKIKGKTERN